MNRKILLILIFFVGLILGYFVSFNVLQSQLNNYKNECDLIIDYLCEADNTCTDTVNTFVDILNENNPNADFESLTHLEFCQNR